MTLSVRVKHLFLLPLLLLMASCSRYSEAEIKGVCSRYFAAEREAYNLSQESNRNYAEYQKWIKTLTLEYPVLDKKTWKRAPKYYEEVQDKVDFWLTPIALERIRVRNKATDLYATILKIQGVKDVDFYRQFKPYGKKYPKQEKRLKEEGSYDFFSPAFKKFEKKERKNIKKANEMFSMNWVNSQAFCKSYGITYD